MDQLPGDKTGHGMLPQLNLIRSIRHSEALGRHGFSAVRRKRRQTIACIPSQGLLATLQR
jgi:hypothetical protein